MTKRTVSKKSNTKTKATKKRTKKTSKSAPVKAAAKPKEPSIFTPEFIQQAILFLIVAASLILTTAHYLQLDDVTNEYIVQNKKFLIPLQWILYLSLTVILFRYALRAIKNAAFNKLDWIVLGASFVLGILFYTVILHPGISDNGDNASYMINAKSLIERGGAFRLYEPAERPDLLASLGLPIMLAPIYAIWGMDLFKMKILVWLMGISLFPLLFHVFKMLTPKMVAAILTIVVFMHPVLFSSASYVMTETPFMFWALMSTVAVMKYQRAEGVRFLWLMLAFLSMMMLYLTRSVGIGAFAAAGAYLFFSMPLKRYFQERNWKHIVSDMAFKKFLFLAGPLFLGAAAYLIYGASRGGSQLIVFGVIDVWDNFWKSGTMTWWILSQISVFDNSIRWLNFARDVDYEALNFKWIALNLLIIFGFGRSLWKKEFVAFLVLFVLLMLYMFNPATNALMATTRYLMILTPFYIYFLYISIKFLTEWIFVKFKRSQLAPYGLVLSLSMLFYIFFTSMSGNSFFITTTKMETTHMPTLQSFFQAAGWCRDNLPPEAIIASRKPRLFYLFSGLKGIGTTHSAQVYDPSKDREKILGFQRQGVDYLIFDRFSSSTVKNILPLIENNPDVFEMVHITSEDLEACFVVKLDYDQL